jgi:hypothetical protein
MTGGAAIRLPTDVRTRHSKRLARRLLRAIKGGDLEAVAALLVRGADVNARSASWWSMPGTTALMLAVRGGFPEVVTLLLSRGADVNAAGGRELKSALMLGVENGRADLVQLLLERGAAVNATAGDNWTALLLAVRAGEHGIIEILLAAGADANARTSAWNFRGTAHGFTVATLAKLRHELRFLGEEHSKRRSATLREEKKWESIQRLLEQADERNRAFDAIES